MIRVLNNSSDLSTWYYKPAVVDGDGTQSSPFNWLEQSTDGGTSIECNIKNSGDHNWYILSLTGGTTYNFTSYSSSYPVSIRIYLQSNPSAVLVDRQYTGSGSESFSFTPDASDLYLFEMYSDPNACSSCTGTSPATISPKPNEITAEGGYEKKKIELSGGIDDFGYLNKYQDIDQANIKYSSFPVSNPAAYYLFDNPQNRLMDNSGNGNDGEIKGTVNFNENIALGSFSSSNYLRFPQLFTGTEDASISMFFQYKSQGGTHQWLISSGSEARSEQSASWILTIADSEVGLMQNYNDNFKDCPMVVDRWYHVVMQYENNVNYVYIDDTFEWSISTAHNLTKVATCIGYSGHLSNHWGSAFSGNVSQLSIFNRSLNSEERRALREFGKLQLGL